VPFFFSPLFFNGILLAIVVTISETLYVLRDGQRAETVITVPSLHFLNFISRHVTV
jgi:hypothetical protein